MTEPPEPTRRTEPVWLEPYPTSCSTTCRTTPPAPRLATRPGSRSSSRSSSPCRTCRRVNVPVLVLRDVLGFRTDEVAGMLGATQASVKGALQRARATLRGRMPEGERDRSPRPDSPRERELVARFATAVESGDVDEVVALLTDDALLTMPPQPLEYQGHDAIAAFLRHRAELRGAALRVVPTRANTQPAFACYLPRTPPSRAPTA